MRKNGLFFKLMVALVLAFSSVTLAQNAAAVVNLDLINPSTGNPAVGADAITASPGSTITLHIKLTSDGFSVASTGNDIGYDPTLFSNFSCTINPAIAVTGIEKSCMTSTPLTGVFRVAILGFNAYVIPDGLLATITFNVASTAPLGDYTLTNTPESSDPGGEGLTTTGSAATIIVGGPSLSISKAASTNLVTPGSELIYTITYGNSGTEGVTNAVITDTVPTNTTFVSATGGGTHSGGVVTWTFSSLAAGATGQTVTFTVGVSSSLQAGAAISNSTYSIDSDETDAVSGTAVTTNVNIKPTADAGGPYTCTVGSTATLSSSASSDSDGTIQSYGWDTDNDGLYDDATGVTTIFSCADDGILTVGVQVTDNDGATATDTATLTASLPPSVKLDLINPSSGNPADESPIIVSPGGTGTLHILLTSDGFSVASTGNDIGYDPTLFSNFSCTINPTIAATGTEKSCMTSTPLTGVFRVAILGFNAYVIPDGLLATITFNVASTAPLGDYTLTNTPESSDPGGEGLTTFGSGAIITVGGPNLTISKAASTNLVTPGSELIYTITYGNSGVEGVTNAVITDTVPTDTTFVSATGGGTESGGVVTWAIGSLAAGATGQTVTFTVTVSGTLTAGAIIGNSTYSIVSAETDAVPGSPVTTSVNIPPTAEAGGPYSCNVGGTFTLDASASADSDGTIVSYEWDFDSDGEYDDRTGETITLTCATAGTFTKGLQVTDDDGATAVATATVNVNAPPVADAGGPYSCHAGESVTLTGANSTDSDGTIASYAWDLDSNGTYETTGATPSYSCTSAGEQAVGLLVTDDDGATAVHTATVSVNALPVADAGWYECLVGDTITLDGTDSYDTDGTITSYAWDLDNDGQYDDATGETTSYSCATRGEQEAGLQVTDNDGATDTAIAYIYIRRVGMELSKSGFTAAGWFGASMEGTVRPGETINYSIYIMNTSASALTNVVVTETIPANTTYVAESASDDGIESDGVITWNIATLAESDSVSFKVQVNANVAAGTIISNSLYTADSGQTDPVSGDPVNASVVVPEIVSVTPGHGEQGQTVFVEIQGENTCWSSLVAIETPTFTREGAIGSILWEGDLDTSQQTITLYAEISEDATVGNWTVTITDTATDISSCQALTTTFRVDMAIEPFIISAQPDAGQQGETLNVTIVGVNTNFDETYTVDFILDDSIDPAITGITVNNEATVADDPATPEDESATILTANISIASDAALGFRGIRVANEVEIADAQGLFTVTPAPETLDISVAIVSPRDGASVSGESVPVVAALIISDISRLVNIVFDVDGTTFATLTTRPFVATFDADAALAALVPPDTDVRITVKATATTPSGEVTATDFIDVIPTTPALADVGTGVDAEGNAQTRVKIIAGQGVEVTTASGQSFTLAPQVMTGLLNSTAAVSVQSTDWGAVERVVRDGLRAPSGVLMQRVAGIDVQFQDAAGDALLSEKTQGIPSEVVLNYPDADNDGTVDGTNIPEDTLQMARDSNGDDLLDQLVEGAVVDADANTVTGFVPGFSGVGLIGVPPAPVLTISKTDSPDPVTPGSNITYTISYSNTGGSDATSVVITDTVPTNTTFDSATGGGTLAAGVVTWNIPTVAAGASGTVTLIVKVNTAVASGTAITNATYSIGSAEIVPAVAGAAVTTTVRAVEEEEDDLCFIATAAYGTPFAYEIDVLRTFRDQFMLPNTVGQAFVKAYYRLSPMPAQYIARHDGLRAATRVALKPVVFSAWMFVEKTNTSWAALSLFGGLVGMFIAARMRRASKRSGQ